MVLEAIGWTIENFDNLSTQVRKYFLSVEYICQYVIIRLYMRKSVFLRESVCEDVDHIFFTLSDDLICHISHFGEKVVLHNLLYVFLSGSMSRRNFFGYREWLSEISLLIYAG